MTGEEMLHAYLSGELRPEQEEEFREWLLQNPEHVREFARAFCFDEQLRRAVIGTRGLEQDLALCVECEASQPLDCRRALHRKPAFWLIAACCIALLGVGMFWRSSATPSAVLDVIAANGEVNVFRGQDMLSGLRLSLLPGDTVRTGAGSSAVLAFRGESTEIALKESTTLVYDGSAAGKAFTLQTGMLHAIVAPQQRRQPLLVRSPKADARVLGTRFALSATADQTMLDVNEGTVRLEPLDRLGSGEFKSGESAVAAGDLPATRIEDAWKLPVPWATQDIGGVAQSGSARMTEGRLEVSASGDDIWNQADAFRYVYQAMEGDVRLIARVVKIDNTDPRAKAGLMIRDGFGAGTRHASISLSARWDAWLHWRPENDQTSYCRQRPGARQPHFIYAPYWVMLERRGSTFTGYGSKDGVNWQEFGSIQLELPSRILAGLHVCSRENSRVNRSAFDNVTIVPLSDSR